MHVGPVHLQLWQQQQCHVSGPWLQVLLYWRCLLNSCLFSSGTDLQDLLLKQVYGTMQS